MAELRRFVTSEVMADLEQVIAALREEPETGTVKFFKEEGWGYITAQDRQDVFVHWSAIEGDGHRSLEPGQPVQFKRRVGTRSVEAIDVRPLRREPLADDVR
jgi:CspA family cold shock protein